MHLIRHRYFMSLHAVLRSNEMLFSGAVIFLSSSYGDASWKSVTIFLMFFKGVGVWIFFNEIGSLIFFISYVWNIL